MLEEHGTAPLETGNLLQVVCRNGLHPWQNKRAERLSVQLVVQGKPLSPYLAAGSQCLGMQVREVNAQRIGQQSRHVRVVRLRNAHAALVKA